MLNPYILIKRAMALGDVLQVTPIVEELYKRYGGECQIDFETHYPDVFKDNPFVRNAILTGKSNPGIYDVVINLDLAYEKFPKMHILDAYKKFAFGGQCNISGQVSLYSSGLDKEYAQQFIKENLLEKYVVVHMRNVNNVDGRNISADIWSDIIEKVLDNTNVKILQVGTNTDLSFNGDDRLIDALGKFTMHQLYEVINYADVFVGADSAPMHIASATNTPIVGLFTTVKAKYREPRRKQSNFIEVATQLPCYGCKEDMPAPHVNFSCGRGDYACVKAFNPLTISEEICKVLLDKNQKVV